MPPQQLKVLPILYKKTATGADQQWLIWTEDNVICTQWGQIDGTLQVARDEVKTGKNVGRSNETTAAQQAELEAQSQWEKKLKKGYVQSLNDAQAGKTDSIIEGGIFPMLAHPFDKQGHKLVYPCFIQPKLDGHRCIATVDANNRCTLWSRTRKPITSMTHIQKAIEALEMPNTIFDGELYNHSYGKRFEELTSFIRDTEYRDGAQEVQYHIYDLPSSWKFEDRWLFLSQHFRARKIKDPIVEVETQPVTDEDDMMVLFNRYLAQGYEGAIARNAAGMYVNKRSSDLLKIKEFDDAEFPVIGVEEGRGKLVGHAIFVCKTPSGIEFRAKMKGETALLKQYFDNPKLAVGRQLTVKYQGYTNKNGVPRFPVALRFREDV